MHGKIGDEDEKTMSCWADLLIYALLHLLTSDEKFEIVQDQQQQHNEKIMYSVALIHSYAEV